MKLRPLQDRVIVKQSEAETRRNNGISRIFRRMQRFGGNE
jgi:co-chaperonin GroES (HSP10)